QPGRGVDHGNRAVHDQRRGRPVSPRGRVAPARRLDGAGVVARRRARRRGGVVPGSTPTRGTAEPELTGATIRWTGGADRVPPRAPRPRRPHRRRTTWRLSPPVPLC